MHTMAMIHDIPHIFVADTPALNNGSGEFASYFNELVNGKLHTCKPERQDGDHQAEVCDLVIVESPHLSTYERLRTFFKLVPPASTCTPDPHKTSVLYLRQPRKPLKSILLVVRGGLEDEIAIGWMVRIAIASQARVTVLGIIPDIPAMYNRYGYIPNRFEDLANSDSLSGYQLRAILKLMAKYGIEGNFHLVQSSPNQQILEVATQFNSDMIIIAAETRGKLMRKWLGELVKPLLDQVDLPVLVAQPVTV